MQKPLIDIIYFKGATTQLKNNIRFHQYMCVTADTNTASNHASAEAGSGVRAVGGRHHLVGGLTGRAGGLGRVHLRPHTSILSLSYSRFTIRVVDAKKNNKKTLKYIFYCQTRRSYKTPLLAFGLVIN